MPLVSLLSAAVEARVNPADLPAVSDLAAAVLAAVSGHAAAVLAAVSDHAAAAWCCCLCSSGGSSDS